MYAIRSYYANAPYNPGTCNPDDTCQPMHDAKFAANALIDTLAEGYDQVAIVTFNTEAFTLLRNNFV